MATLPVPVADDPDTKGFWDAAARGRIAVLHCLSCGHALHLPRAYCSFCGSWDTTWREMAPHAMVYSYSVVEHQVHPAFVVPYTVLLLALDEDPTIHLLGHLDGRPDITIGMRMRATFDDNRNGVVVPQWIPDEQVSY